MAFNEERSHPNGWNKEKLVSRYVTEGGRKRASSILLLCDGIN